VGNCAEFIRRRMLEAERMPPEQLMETLADALASIEYFLEDGSRMSGEPREDVLDLAEQSVEALGLPVACWWSGAPPAVRPGRSMAGCCCKARRDSCRAVRGRCSAVPGPARRASRRWPNRGSAIGVANRCACCNLPIRRRYRPIASGSACVATCWRATGVWL